jgi:TPR repeat protein
MSWSFCRQEHTTGKPFHVPTFPDATNSLRKSQHQKYVNSTRHRRRDSHNTSEMASSCRFLRIQEPLKMSKSQSVPKQRATGGSKKAAGKKRNPKPAEKVKLLNGEVMAPDPAAAARGDPQAQYMLGACYYFGVRVNKEPKEALKWLQLAAEQGHTRAQSALGTIYYTGEGVAKNIELALRWFHPAAASDDARAQGSLGECYMRGWGVPKNLEKALVLLRKAADKGYSPSQSTLGIAYYIGYGVKKDLEKAGEWIQRAAANGSAESQYLLGNCYLTGHGYPNSQKTRPNGCRRQQNRDIEKRSFFLANVMRPA